MQIFATLNADGAPTAFYPSDLWPPGTVPEDAVEITSEQWRECLDHQGQRRFSDGSLVPYAPPAPPPAIPQQVPMWAAQAALKQAGKYDAINAAILQMEMSNPPAYFAWTMGNFASRQSAFIGTLASQFGMSAADIDAVFVAADRIAQVAG